MTPLGALSAGWNNLVRTFWLRRKKKQRIRLARKKGGWHLGKKEAGT